MKRNNFAEKAGPERASAQAKPTVTFGLFQPLAFAGVREGVIVGGVCRCLCRSQ
jgi:hypothetical protein